MSTTVAQLNVKVGGDTSDAKSKLNDVSTHVNTVAGHFKSALGNVLGFATGVGAINAVAGATGFLAGQIKDVISQGQSQQAVMNETANTLAHMGKASGQTADSIGDYADTMARATGVSDDLIQHSENVLLTFGNLGKNIFPQAETAALNMSVMLKTDLQSSVIQVGKALNDPVKGMNALAREGVSFSAVEQQNIKDMEAHNNIAGAQAIVMSELNKQFGGAAVSAGQGFGGALARLNVIADQAKEKLGLALIPVLQSLLTSIMPLVSGIGSFLPGAINALMAVVGPLLSMIIDLGKTFFSALQPGIIAVMNGFKGLQGSLNIAWSDILEPFWWLAKTLGESLASGLKLVAGLIKHIDFFSLANGAGNAAAFLNTLWVELQKNVMPSIVQLASYIQSNVLPTLLQFAGFIQANIIPVLLTLGVFIIKNVVPMIIQLVGWFAKNLVPILETLWGVIQKNVIPALESIWKSIASNLLPAVQGLISKLAPVLVPAFQAIGFILKNVVGPALSFVIGIIGKLIDFLSLVIGKLGDFLGLLGNIRDAAGNALGGLGNTLHDLHIPGFATGGVIAQGGLAMVGEHGPEVVALPTGSRVYPNGTGPKTGHTFNNYFYSNMNPKQVTDEMLWQMRMHA